MNIAPGAERAFAGRIVYRRPPGGVQVACGSEESGRGRDT
jgi:hypothetical protein